MFIDFKVNFIDKFRANLFKNDNIDTQFIDSVKSIYFI